MDENEISKQRAYFRDLLFEKSAQSANYAISSGQGALRSAFLANGAAILALLTLVGNANAEFGERGLWWSFAWFGSGIISAVVGQLAMYRSQSNFSSGHFEWAKSIEMGNESDTGEKDSFIGLGFTWIKVLFCASIVSMSSFVIGSFVALEAIL